MCLSFPRLSHFFYSLRESKHTHTPTERIENIDDDDDEIRIDEQVVIETSCETHEWSSWEYSGDDRKNARRENQQDIAQRRRGDLRKGTFS